MVLKRRQLTEALSIGMAGTFYDELCHEMGTQRGLLRLHAALSRETRFGQDLLILDIKAQTGVWNLSAALRQLYRRACLTFFEVIKPCFLFIIVWGLWALRTLSHLWSLSTERFPLISYAVFFSTLFFTLMYSYSCIPFILSVLKDLHSVSENFVC